MSSLNPVSREDIKLGRVCNSCGEYFKKAIPIGEESKEVVYHHGREAICHDCFSEMEDYERRTYAHLKSHHNNKF